jgi:hypothetical protein
MKRLAYIPFIALMLAGTTSCEKTALTEVLNTSDQEALLFMIEEEKLARDVYTELGSMWSAHQFQMIKDSEQSHVNAIAAILNANGIEYDTLPMGQFNDEGLQILYDDLINLGSGSELEALKVGATIEDLDLVDLEEYAASTANPTLISLYDDLMCGSRNHLRAFMNGITNKGGTYTPQYLDQDEFDAILAGDHESCGG